MAGALAEAKLVRELTTCCNWLWGCYVGDDTNRRANRQNDCWAEDVPPTRCLFYARVVEG